MLTRKPFASQPRSGVREALNESFQHEMICLGLAVCLFALILDPGLLRGLRRSLFLISMLLQPRDLNDLQNRLGPRRRTLLCAWALAASLTVIEWNSQLLFVFQNLKVDYSGGETLLNTTAQLNSAVEAAFSRKSSAGKDGTEDLDFVPEIVCFVDEASTMFLGAETFDIPLTAFRSKGINFTGILRASR